MKDTRLRVYDKQNKKMRIFDPLSVCCDGDYGGNDSWWVEGDEDIQIQVPDIRKKDLYSDPMHPTGLKDKNGKEIYEGDILVWYPSPTLKNYPKEMWYVVEWYQAEWYIGFCFRSLRKHLWNEPKFTWHVKDDCAIVGNIYESPGLLKEKSASNHKLEND